MKIIIISPGVLPIPSIKGGAVETLIDFLIDYNEAHEQHDLTIYSIYHPEAVKLVSSYRSCSFKFIRIPAWQRFLSRYCYSILNRILPIYLGNSYINKVIKDMKGAEYDAIVAENLTGMGLLLRKRSFNNLILHLHNDYFHEGMRRGKAMIGSYDQILCVSDFIQHRVRTVSEDSNIRTLYNGTDLDRFHPLNYSNHPEQIRKQYGIDSKDIVIIYTGRLVPEKGIKELLEAFIGMYYGTGVKLLIVGSSFFAGSNRSTFIKGLERKARTKQDNIIFTGYIPYHRMPEIYAIANIGVIPSIYEEAFGLTLLEQMSMSLPTIISDSGALKEIVNEKCSLIVKRGKSFVRELSAALDLLVANKELREAYGKAARIQAEHYTKEAYCRNFYTFMDKEVDSVHEQYSDWEQEQSIL